YRSREDALLGYDGQGIDYPGDACVGKYETEEEAREALANMPSEIEYNRYRYSRKYIRTDYSIFRTVEDASEPSWDEWIADSEAPKEE
ncbi:MAG: hypothetical protein IKS06_07370, partial [Lachnospiraceae bacterium]|nr:hypothetical protein [Lachnospiraceae bacterium]